MTPIYTDPESRLRAFMILIRDNPRASGFAKQMARFALEDSCSALHAETIAAQRFDDGYLR
jgi:hypothetical protein